MVKHDRWIKITLLIAGDFILLFGALPVALYLRYYPNPEWDLIGLHFFPFSIIFILWLVMFGAFGLYDLRFMQNNKRFFYRLLRTVATNTVITILVLYLIPHFEIEPRRNLFLIAVTGTMFIAAWRYLFNILILRTPTSKVIFFGSNQDTLELIDWLAKNPQLGQKPVAFISAGEGIESTHPQLPNFTLSSQNLPHIIKDTGADTIVVSRDIKENKALVKILFQVIPLGVGVAEFSTYHEMLTGKIPLSLIGEIWFLENLVGIRKNFYEFFKRTLDIILALILSTISIAIFPLIASAIKLDSRGPIFFRQKRAGRNGKAFEILKFRSMVKDAEKFSGFKGNGKDARHTRVGSFLRGSYLDEIPQILNIVKGEMSFIGPRPERPEYVEQLKQKIPFYEMRLLVQPGITGWAQINMEDDASVEDTPEKMQYDLYYIKNRSFVLDLLIAIRTAFIILRRKGR